ncbi:10688_t:CDS:2, partial [Acaulospora morrowiae]
SISELEMPSGKDLGCGDSRKRGHNAEDCPKEDKFFQGSSGTKGTQLDKDGELGCSSKDSYTANSEERYNKEIDRDLRKEKHRLQQHPCRNTEHLEEITTGHPSKDLEERLDNNRTLTTEDKRNNNINEGEGNTGGCLEEKTILMRTDPEGGYTTVQKKLVNNKPDFEDTRHTMKGIELSRNSQIQRLEIEYHQYDTCTITVRHHLVNWSKVSNQAMMASLTTSLAITLRSREITSLTYLRIKHKWRNKMIDDLTSY